MRDATAARVLFVNSRLDATENPGGDTIQVRETQAALEALGLTVHVRSPSELTELPDFDLAHVFNLQMPDTASQVFETLRALRRPIAFSPIYWDTLACWFETAVAERARWRWPARLLGTERARELYVGWQRRKEPGTDRWKAQRRLLQEAVRILPNSRAEADSGATFAMGGGFHDKCDVVRNGVNPSLYQQEPTPSRSFQEKYDVRDCVLQVGTISPVKNQLGLINALFDLSVPLVFIGHTPHAMNDYARQCRDRAKERGRVVFVDHLASDELPGIYALAAVHALPSWRETPGLVSLEAAACGCRIVTTSVGSAHEYFGDLAWYCHPGSIRSIREAVEAALAAPRSSVLRGHVLTNFTWQRAGETTLAAYQRLLGRTA